MRKATLTLTITMLTTLTMACQLRRLKRAQPHPRSVNSRCSTLCSVPTRTTPTLTWCLGPPTCLLSCARNCAGMRLKRSPAGQKLRKPVFIRLSSQRCTWFTKTKNRNGSKANSSHPRIKRQNTGLRSLLGDQRSGTLLQRANLLVHDLAHVQGVGAEESGLFPQE